jgi:hypothetical protein
MKNNILFYVAILISIIAITMCILTFIKKPDYPVTDNDVQALRNFNEIFVKNITVDNDNDTIYFQIPTNNLYIGAVFDGSNENEVDYFFKLNAVNPSDGDDTYDIFSIKNLNDDGKTFSFKSDNTAGVI